LEVGAKTITILTFCLTLVNATLSVITLNADAKCHYAVCHNQIYNAECHHAECHYAECHYEECHYTECCGATLIGTVKRLSPSNI
jgi:hypothetical protein